mgnify:CR=1 FL=1
MCSRLLLMLDSSCGCGRWSRRNALDVSHGFRMLFAWLSLGKLVTCARLLFKQCFSMSFLVSSLRFPALSVPCCFSILLFSSLFSLLSSLFSPRSPLFSLLSSSHSHPRNTHVSLTPRREACPPQSRPSRRRRALRGRYRRLHFGPRGGPTEERQPRSCRAAIMERFYGRWRGYLGGISG